MSQVNVSADDDSEEETREQLKTTHGHERRELDLGDDDSPIADMDSKRQAPIESVAKNVVNRYDVPKAFIREYLANAHTACIQRAKFMIRQAGLQDQVNMFNVREVLDLAESEFGYEPVIEVRYNQDPTARWTFKVADNGIGVDSDTAYALRDIGLSGWHMDGSSNGMFGQGTMSGFLPVGEHGEFHMDTLSAVTDESFGVAWKLTDLNDLGRTRDAVGTTFTWPVFNDEGEDIDVYEAVREYSEGLIVPVIYEEYDENGEQTGNSDEFLPEFLEERYPDEALVITYEDEYGKVVWSPEDPEGWNTNINTFCGYQPIKRNDPGFSHKKYEMPSAFDFRLKVEDGSIIEVRSASDAGDGTDEATMDHELVGKTPISDMKYRSMLVSERDVVPEGYVDDSQVGYVDPKTGDLYTTDENVAARSSDVTHTANVGDTVTVKPAVIEGKQAGKRIVSDDEWSSMDEGRVGEEFVRKSEIPDDVEVLQAMEPTDDRDRFERKQVDDVLRRYSERLWDELRDRTASVFESVDTFDDVFDLEGNDQALFHKGVDRFGPRYSRSEPETVQEEIADELGVQLPLDVCEKIDVMKKTVSLAPRDCYSPQKKESRTKKPVWKVLRKARDGDKDGDVYMGFRITEQKARLAWELDDDNVVVQTTKRDLYADRLGWKDMRDLPTKGFEAEFEDHDFDEDFLDEWDRSRHEGDTTDASGGLDSEVKELSYNDKRAMKRDVTVRRGSGTPGTMAEINGETLFEGLDDPRETVSFKSYDIEQLVLYRDTEHSVSVGDHLANKGYGTFYAVVPNYVYDYLIEADEVYTESEYMDHVNTAWIDFDWSSNGDVGRTFGDADARDVFVMSHETDLDAYDEYDARDEFREKLTEDLSDQGRLDDDESIRSISYMRPSDLDDFYPMLNQNGCYEPDPDEERPSVVTFTKNSGYGNPCDLSLDRRTLFLDTVLGDLDQSAPEWKYFDVDIDDTDMIESLIRLQDAGGFVSTDDDFEIPVPDDDRTSLGRGYRGDVEVSRGDVLITKTLERLEDAGGFVGEDG